MPLSQICWLTADCSPDDTMVIGTLEVRLLVRESRTLKDKRQVVRSILDRLKRASTCRPPRWTRTTT